MTRAFLARALRSLASLVAGDDPAALAIAEAARARAEAERAVDLARLALTSAERAVDGDAVTMEVALRTRGVVGAMLREGVAEVEGGADALVAAGALTREQVDAWPMRSPTVTRSRELLADLADAEDEPPRVAGGDD